MTHPRLTRGELADIVWDTLPVLLVVVKTGLIAEVSEPAANMFRYARSELIGMEVEALVPTPLRAVHVAHRGDYEKNPVMRPMGHHSSEVRGLRQDGTTFLAAIQLCPTLIQEQQCVLVMVSEQPARSLV